MTKRMMAWIIAIAVAVALAISVRLSAQEQPQQASQAHRTTFTTINFPGSSGTSAWGINRRGDIAGIYYNSNFQAHGFLLHKGTFTKINAPGATQTFVYGINDHDDIVGGYNDNSGKIHGFLLHKPRDEERDEKDGADLGTFTIIDAPAASGFTTANGINRQGDIVGFYFDSKGTGHGFLLKRHDCEGEDVNGLGTFTAIDVPGAFSTSAQAINSEGDIVGTYRKSSTNPFDAPSFLLRDGKLTFINVPNTTYTAATGINAEGDIVGSYRDTSSNTYRGFVLHDRTFTYLKVNGMAIGINGRGDIVGEYFPGPQGFLLTNLVDTYAVVNGPRR